MLKIFFFSGSHKFQKIITHRNKCCSKALIYHCFGMFCSSNQSSKFQCITHYSKINVFGINAQNSIANISTNHIDGISMTFGQICQIMNDVRDIANDEFVHFTKSMKKRLNMPLLRLLPVMVRKW